MTKAEFYLEDLKSKYKKIDPTKYYLSYSGGKDSHLLYWFQKEYCPEYKSIPVISANTYMEHHEILKRIQDNADRVLLPELKPYEIKEKFGIPCFSKHQDYLIWKYQTGHATKSVMDRINRAEPNFKYNLSKKASTLLLSGQLHKISPKCCEYLKKRPFHIFEKETGLKPILGVRGTESVLRESKYTSCFTKDKKFTPLFDLSDKLEKQIYFQFKIPIPKVYDTVARTGCMGCPYGSYKLDTGIELCLISKAQRWFVLDYFKESYEVLGIHGEDYRF